MQVGRWWVGSSTELVSDSVDLRGSSLWLVETYLARDKVMSMSQEGQPPHSPHGTALLCPVLNTHHRPSRHTTH